MEFYALPSELERWLSYRLDKDHHWVLSWAVVPNVYQQVSLDFPAKANRFEPVNTGPGPEFFIGNKEISHAAVMKMRHDATEEIDFLQSFCVRLVPSFVVGNVLLEGRIETFPFSKYIEYPFAKCFWSWKTDLIASLRAYVFRLPAVANQRRQDGTVKTWNKVLVSPAAVDWCAQGGKLKQFTGGSVEFTPKFLNYS